MVEQTFSVNLPFFFHNGNDFGVDECGLGFSAISGDSCLRNYLATTLAQETMDILSWTTIHWC